MDPRVSYNSSQYRGHVFRTALLNLEESGSFLMYEVVLEAFLLRFHERDFFCQIPYHTGYRSDLLAMTIDTRLYFLFLSYNNSENTDVLITIYY